MSIEPYDNFYPLVNSLLAVRLDIKALHVYAYFGHIYIEIITFDSTLEIYIHYKSKNLSKKNPKLSFVEWEQVCKYEVNEESFLKIMDMFEKQFK